MTTKPDYLPLPFATFDSPDYCPECGDNLRDCTCNQPTRCRCANWRLTVPEGSIVCGACGLPIFEAMEINRKKLTSELRIHS